MRNIYGFTNENITSFSSLYDFNKAKVLSVLGSGDQYFASILYGALDVELYDVNERAWDFFLLKYYGISYFDYDHFFDFFVTKELNDRKSFDYLLGYLPENISNSLLSLYKTYSGLSECLTPDIANICYDDGHIIPYFDKKEYYRLQEMLRDRKLPKFYLEDFINLPSELSNSHYDIVLASNIFYWLYLDEEEERVFEYKELLEKFDCSVVQALYSWSLPAGLERKFLDNGFDIDSVASAKKFQLYDDKVVSFRKVKR